MAEILAAAESSHEPALPGPISREPGTSTRVTAATLEPLPVDPPPTVTEPNSGERILYFVPPAWMTVVGLNNRGQFVALQADGAHPGERSLVLGTWGDPSNVKQVLPWAELYSLNGFIPIGLDDKGIVAGKFVQSMPQGTIHFATAWLDSSSPNVHWDQAGATSAEWDAFSRGGQAGGFAQDWTEGPTCWRYPTGNSSQRPLIGHFDSPRTAPILDSISMRCTGCSSTPTFEVALENKIVGVNDFGEAVGVAQVRVPASSCKVLWNWGNPVLNVTGIEDRPIYVGPGGMGVVDLSGVLLPRAANPTLVGINNAGEILGRGAANGKETAFRYNIHTNTFATPPLSTANYPWFINANGYALLRVCSTNDGYCGQLRTAIWTPDNDIIQFDVDFNLGASLNDQNQLIASWCLPSISSAHLGYGTSALLRASPS